MKKHFYRFYQFTALLLLAAMFSPLLAIAPDGKNKSKSLTEDQKILHVLNRLGFGARDGDIEKVKKIGIKNYIERQLNASPEDAPDVAARLKNLEVLDMTTAEIFAKYPNPGALLKMMNGGKTALANKNAAADDEQMTDERKKQQRQEIKEIYQKYDLRPANQIVYQQATSRVIRGVYSENQLEEQMVDFWMNHFNVYAGKAAVKWYLPSYERDVIRKNALGNFKDLLVGTAQHPAMLFFLDNFQSIAPNATANKNPNAERLQKMLQNGQVPPRMRERLRERGLTDEQIDQRIAKAKQNAGNNKKNQRGINENYARELMELHTLGVDGGYTQKDVQEVARAFTGWTIADPRGYRKAAGNMIADRDSKALDKLQKTAGVPDDLESGEFYFNSNWHDKGEKTILGQKVDAGGMKDGLKVIDILVSQPATANFIARKLAVKFVSDNPSEAYVQRIADAFHKSNGDIKTTLRAMFDDSEFFAAENYRAKIKTPFELLVSSLRALNADVKASPTLLALLGKMGEPLYGYQAPTGYPDTAEDWVNTGALLERINFAVALASNRIPQVKVDLRDFSGGSKNETLNRSVAEILKDEIAPATRQTLLKQIEQPLVEPKVADDDSMMETEMTMNGGGQGGKRGMNRQMRLNAPSGNPEVFKVVGLLLGSPDFQRQ